MPKEKGSRTPQFETKEYDVSPSTCCWLMWCPLTYGFSLCLVPYKITLELGPEEGMELVEPILVFLLCFFLFFLSFFASSLLTPIFVSLFICLFVSFFRFPQPSRPMCKSLPQTRWMPWRFCQCFTSFHFVPTTNCHCCHTSLLSLVLQQLLWEECGEYALR